MNESRAKSKVRTPEAKVLMNFILLFFLFLIPLPMAAQESQPQSGEYLYIAKGCLGCHGASGIGGVGPSLVKTTLTLDAFISQLRKPRAIMPKFEPETVSDAQARTVYEYVRALPAVAPKIGAIPPSGELAEGTCAECHQKHNPTIVQQFATSAMGMEGIQNPRIEYAIKKLSCAGCHGTNHDLIMASKGRVTDFKCGECHPQIYKEHVVDAGHSYGPGPGDLGINWSRNIDVPHYKQMPRKVMEMGCDPCHAQAGADDDKYWSKEQNQYVDTSSLVYRNGCISCHTRHSFSLEEARKPEACFTCHMGPDHPNYETYISSKHGAIYLTKGYRWDWNTPMADANWDAPTCAYCHMVYVDAQGKRYSSHNMTKKIIWGMGVQAAMGSLEDITVSKENQAKRVEMVKVCMKCHSEDKARDYLKSADAHKLAGDALVVEARNILIGLYKDGLIEVKHGQEVAGLVPGPRFTAIDLPGKVAQHWPAGLYFNVSAIEREYFDMFFFSNLKSYKGAFHMSPDYSWWYGYAEALGHLARIRDEAEQLKTAVEKQQKKR